MFAVVVDVVGVLLAVFHAANATADGGFAVVVLAQFLRVGQHGFEELQRHDVHLGRLRGVVGQWCFVADGVDACHANLLNDVQIVEVLLSEGHPEARLFDGGIVFHQRLQLLVVHEIAVAWADVGVGNVAVHGQRFGFNPLSILVIKSLLCDFANVDFGIEVRCKSLVVVACIAIDDI